MHSTAYLDPRPFKGLRVAVVGGSLSAVEVSHPEETLEDQNPRVCTLQPNTLQLNNRSINPESAGLET